MIEMELKLDNKKLFFKRKDPVVDANGYSVVEYDHYTHPYVFNNEIVMWFFKNYIYDFEIPEYSLAKMKLTLRFKNKKDALFFKMVWC